MFRLGSHHRPVDIISTHEKPGHIAFPSTSIEHSSCRSEVQSNTIVFQEGRGISKSSTFEVIVLTYNRAKSLRRCLESIEHAFYDNHVIRLSIWIDRSLKGSRVNKDVLNIAINCTWSHGIKIVHVWDKHVGLYGQWLDTFNPMLDNHRAVIIEDDLELSPHYYTWLKGASESYSKRPDIFGYTLQKGTLRADQRSNKLKLSIPETEKVFLYLLVGSWGYSPEPKAWRRFRKWFHNSICNPSFKPYVDGLITTAWYKSQEKKKTMWTMWHIWFANKYKLYTVYANLNDNRTLAASWNEIGLHFSKSMPNTGEKDFETFGSPSANHSTIVSKMNFIFPSSPILVNWNGTYVNRNGALEG